MIRRIVARIVCLFGRHTPRRRSIWHDDIDRRSRCAGCNRPLRSSMSGQWQLFDTRRDANPHRQPHPRFDR